MGLSISPLTVIVCISNLVAGNFENGGSPSHFGGKEDLDTSKEILKGWFPLPWLSNTFQLGQVSGVSLDKSGSIHVFHRADRVWGISSFNVSQVYQERHRGPISTSTILVFHSNGTLLKQWGNNMFYLPHGITVDYEDNVWVTDVALHQVMKFSTPYFNNSVGNYFVLGEPFVPGSDSSHFCKPTSVAVASNGDFFVADGYCNARILKYNAAGVKILEWGRYTVHPEQVQLYNIRHPTNGEFNIPHSLTLAEDKSLVCVADRENGRVQCFNMDNGTFSMEMSSPRIGSRIFSVAYSPGQGGLFFVLNGPDGEAPVGGFVLSSSGQLLSRFGVNLQNPHDIAVTHDGSTLYLCETDPHKAWKYVHNKSVSSVDVSTVQSAPLGIGQQPLIGNVFGAVLITGACLVFGMVIFITAIVHFNSKKSGCGHCKGNTWLLQNGSGEGFKLGNILGHEGFEKLNTRDESDEEQPLA